ncbi:succinyl-diaminopimelate desuccinylase [soil metagenome]
MDLPSPLPPLADPLSLAQALIRRPSVTPLDEGAMALVEQALTSLGFTVGRMPFGGIENLYARRGGDGPNLCFAGHTDVVPPGDPAAWTTGPFEAAVEAGVLIGRGAADMKGSIAAFIAAVARSPQPARGSLSFLITGDEEGEALDGTKRVVEALIAQGERVDHCIVGEPTSSAALGDMVKIGRRGSLNGWITVEGVQGHVAYPDRAANPIPVLVELLHRLGAERLDEGFEGFQPSNLEITEIEVGNPANNVIPPRARARFNVRFNPNWTGEALLAKLREACAVAGEGFRGSVSVEGRASGEAFLTQRGDFTDVICAAVREATGREPELSTSGGTSDARFIRALCPVVEFGLVGASMHKVNEAVPVADLETLTTAYEALIRGYFETFGGG